MGGHRTRTLRGPAWTVNSFPGRTPLGTVTRYTWEGPLVVRDTWYAPGLVPSEAEAEAVAEVVEVLEVDVVPAGAVAAAALLLGGADGT